MLGEPLEELEMYSSPFGRVSTTVTGFRVAWPVLETFKVKFT
jgi:hypothetical protein